MAFFENEVNEERTLASRLRLGFKVILLKPPPQLPHCRGSGEGWKCRTERRNGRRERGRKTRQGAESSPEKLGLLDLGSHPVTPRMSCGVPPSDSENVLWEDARLPREAEIASWALRAWHRGNLCGLLNTHVLGCVCVFYLLKK